MTATAASGLFLLTIPAWALLRHGSGDGDRPAPPAPANPPVGVGRLAGA